MRSVNIKFELVDRAWLLALASADEQRESTANFAGTQLILPPHFSDGRNLTGPELLSTVIDLSQDIAVNMVAALLYDALKSGKIRRLFVSGKAASTPEQIESALKPANETTVDATRQKE